jgi:hypothetical protein
MSAKMALERQGFSFRLRLIMHGHRDLVRSWIGVSPHKIPIVGNPGSIACLTSEDAYGGYSEPASNDLINDACASIIIRGDKYRLVKYAHKAPLLGFRQKLLFDGICASLNLMDQVLFVQ